MIRTTRRQREARTLTVLLGVCSVLLGALTPLAFYFAHVADLQGSVDVGTLYSVSFILGLSAMSAVGLAIMCAYEGWAR